MSAWRGATVAAALAAILLPAAAGAQQLAQRVSSAPDGVVRFGFAAREGVEVCDQGVRVGESVMNGRDLRWGERMTGCRAGVIEVDLRVREGVVREVDVVRGLDPRPTVDLGSVPVGEAVGYLGELARGAGQGRADRGAVLAIHLAGLPETWRVLLTLARERAVRSEVRRNALFWAGQDAAEAVTAGLTGLAMDEDEDQGVRDAAVFALSQRPEDESVPALMELARTASGVATRKKALFWLAQSDDERVPAFFESLLVGKGG